MTTLAMAVGVGQEQSARGWLTLSVDDLTEDQGEEESCTILRRVSAPSVQECGFRFQRCGGGRRVIRKQRGGA